MNDLKLRNDANCLKKIDSVLISVTKKDELLVKLVENLIKRGVKKIKGTGGTCSFLKEHGIEIQEISDARFRGRIKTLNQDILSGILCDRETDKEEIEKYKTETIDLVIVNLYNFVSFSNSCNEEKKIKEMIDIGGPTMIRAAAKNYENVCVIVDPEDYKYVYSAETDLEFRRKMFLKVFALTSHYDCSIYNYYTKDEQIKENLRISLEKSFNFRYGENPHQKSCFYGKLPINQIQGKELSYNNLIDLESAYSLVNEFQQPTAVIVKHSNPCGVCCSDSLINAYEEAFNCDPISSFGGIVAFNGNVNKDLAIKCSSVFLEVIVAKSFDDDAIDVFSSKKNLRIITINESYSKNKFKIKTLFGGIALQEVDDYVIKQEDLKLVTKSKPSDKEIIDMIFAWKVCKHLNSNAIVIAKDLKTIGLGVGQTNRVQSLEIALNKKTAEKLNGSVLASDGFFPFEDSIILASKHKISSIIQPGGSVKDSEVIEAADKNNISMLFTNKRCFKH